MRELLVRGGGGGSAALAGGVVLALAASGDAIADGYYVENTVGTWAKTYVQHFGSPEEIPGPMRLRIVRGEQELENREGGYSTYPDGSAVSDVTSGVELLTGDRVELYNPTTAEVANRIVVWDARPTVDSCPVGSTEFGGLTNPGMQMYVSVRRPTEEHQPWSPWRFDEAAVTEAGDRWTGRVEAPLAAGDMVEMAAIYSPVAGMSVSRSAHMVAGTCAPAPPSPGFLSFTGWDGAVERLTAAQRRSGVTVRVRCAAASGIPCRGRTRVQTARRYARAGGKRARVTFASSAVSLAPGKSRVVRLKLRKAGRRLIDKHRRVKAEVTAVTADPSGAPIAKTLPLVLVR